MSANRITCKDGTVVAVVGRGRNEVLMTAGTHGQTEVIPIRMSVRDALAVIGELSKAVTTCYELGLRDGQKVEDNSTARSG